MAKYHVTVWEVWVRTTTIEAVSEEDAVRLVTQGEGEGEDDSFEYSRVLDSEAVALDE